MAMLIDGNEVVDRFEIWTVKTGSDPDDEIAFDDRTGAELEIMLNGGKLWMRQGYATAGHEVTDDD